VTLASYAALARLRREHLALTRGGLRWALAGDDALAFLREHPTGSVLVHTVRAATEDAVVPAGPLGLVPAGTTGRLLWSTDPGAGDLRAGEDGTVVLPGAGPHASLWLLPAPSPSAPPRP
jgi:alpha-glucosidase